MDAQTNLTILFGVIVVGFLILDLGFFNKKSHKIKFKPALYQSIFWVAISLVFGLLILFFLSKEVAVEFFSAYVTEKMLSVDNLFVIMLIFSFFNLEEKYHHKALFWGILGAIVFRGIFIGVGAYVIHQFFWVLYIFGAVLLYTGIKLLRDKKEEHIDFKDNKIIKFAHKILPFTANHHNGKFFLRENGKFHFTSLFMIVLLVETTDIIFAVDSIPAVFAISQNLFVVFTSNIFAILGLRALFFLIENILHKFHHLQKGLAFILIFIGLKMFAPIFGIHMHSLVSFGIIMFALVSSIILSLIFPKKI
ncbi:tellurium resistance protein TerC [Candidatus Nomurabacteria bacterium RIFOXYB1_FULL_39_16]|uniref:Integral membrane protein TerC n=2 Tax=Candidatus Nomuraibacteriota TaxID=1752729 RepID=A0A0G0QU26_9BACT|nr:MAG: Integral membrane protein TerC [Candidatus Nomurabacteria bacterium GW2011_GWF2_40_12]OGJ09377.1 MAG: tellurium resistance protein TerC [Candidatus Nomurabacteria bacterium RIFOXYB1_FULL_39_16]